MDWPALYFILTVYIAGLIIPGPNFVAVSHTGFTQSTQHAIALVAGIVSINILWCTSALLGLTALFQVMPWVSKALSILGAIYLMWYGLTLIRKAKAVQSTTPDATSETLLNCYTRGLRVNLANPKSIAFYGAIFSAAAPAQLNIPTFLCIVAMVCVLSFGWYASVGVFFSAPPLARFFQRIKKHFERVCGGLLILLGCKQAVQL